MDETPQEMRVHIQLLEDKLIEAENKIVKNDEIVWEMMHNIIEVMNKNGMVVRTSCTAKYDKNQLKLVRRGK